MAHHHIHKRKRAQLQEYPHPSKPIRHLDAIVSCAAILGPIMTLPQIFEIWFYQNAAGISLITWFSYLILAFPLLLYAYVHDARPLKIMYFLWIIIDIGVISGTFLYQ